MNTIHLSLSYRSGIVNRFDRLGRVLRVVVSLLCLMVTLTACGQKTFARQPDIIWILAEDISNELSCYGEPGVKTPNIDQLAAEGTRYNRAYVTAPGCSTSRSAIITGVYGTRIDASDHRRIGDVVAPTFPQALRKEGYYNAIGFGYRGKTDFNFKPAEKVFDGGDWKDAQPGQPIFAQTTLFGTHRLDAKEKQWNAVRDQSAHPVNPDEVVLPPYFPDVPEVRHDWVVYLDQIEKMDGQVGDIIQRLKDEGRYDDAMIIFMGDNGRCHLRAKNWSSFKEGLSVVWMQPLYGISIDVIDVSDI